MTPFAPGQVWTYSTRPGEEASRVIICRAEDEPNVGLIVHVHLNGLRVKSRHAPDGFTKAIHHMPYAADALRKSLVRLESTDEAVPPFEDGYRQWRDAFDDGKAGVWTIPLAEAVATMEGVMNG